MEVSFQPHISFRGEYVVLTAPHAVRERAWNILNIVSDFYIFEKKGGVGTQILAQPNPGYNSRHVYVIMATTAYLAASDQATVDMIWSTPLHILLAGINNVVKLDIPGQPPLTEEEISFMFSAWVENKSVKALEDAIYEGFLGLGYREGVLSDWLNEVIESFRRLNFSPVKDNAHVPPSGGQKAVIERFTEALEKGKRINKAIEHLRDGCRSDVKEYRRTFTFDDDGLKRWSDLLADISLDVMSAQSINSTFGNEEALISLLREVRLSTPPAPPSPIIKK